MKINTNFTLEATPERVYALLKLIEYNKYSREELKSLVQPLQNNETELNKVLSYLQDCDWVKENRNGKFELNFDLKDLHSIESFRKRINSILFSGDKTLFYLYTTWVLKQSEDILAVRIADYTKENSDLIRDGNSRFYLQWRLWAAFLGIGNLHNRIFIPNPSLRMKDVIEYYGNDLDNEKVYPLNEFLNWLMSKCPELRDCISENSISVFLSLALRDLHDRGVIKLEYHQDYPEIWYMSSSSFHEIDRKVTHISLRGGTNE